MWQPVALLIEQAGSKVPVHAASAAGGFAVCIRICIQLGKKLLNRAHAAGKHKSLVAVITAAPVAILKHLGHGNLGNFFTIAKNAKFGFTGEYFFAANKAGLTAFEGQSVIV